MIKEKYFSSYGTIAKIVSYLFHPLLMPLYGLLIIFTAPAILWYLPYNVKKIIFFVVATNNVLIPLLLIIFSRYKNIIRSLTVE